MKTYCFLHLYYKRYTQIILEHAVNIPNLEKMYVNIPKNQLPRADGKAPIPDENAKEYINKHINNVEYFNFENTGRDPGGYFRMTKEAEGTIDPEDVVFCIHTKACNLGGGDFGFQWMSRLLQPILKSKELGENTLKYFEEDSDVGVVGSGFERKKYYGPQNKKNCTMLYDRLGIKEENRWGAFVAGTIFAARYSILQKTFSVIEESDFSTKDNISGDGRVPHALERMFSAVARNEGKKVVYTTGVGSP